MLEDIKKEGRLATNKPIDRQTDKRKQRYPVRSSSDDDDDKPSAILCMHILQKKERRRKAAHEGRIERAYERAGGRTVLSSFLFFSLSLFILSFYEVHLFFAQLSSVGAD